MLTAIGRMGSGSESGTFLTQGMSSDSVIAAASSSPMPCTLGARAASESLLPRQSGQVPSARKRSMRFMPFSSFTLDRAFSTVWTAL